MTIEIAAYQRNLEIENKLYQKDLEALLEKRSQENKELMAMYQTIFDNSLMGLTILQDEKFVFANNRTAEIFGLPADEFLTLSMREIMGLLHPDDRETVVALSQARLAGAEPARNTRIRIITRDGQLRYLQTYVSMVQFRGKPALHQTFLDITEYVR